MIVHLTSEVAPFYKRGGLGDVVGALPLYLKERQPNAVISFFYEGRMKGINLQPIGLLTINIQGVRYDFRYYHENHQQVDFYFLNMSDSHIFSDLETGANGRLEEDSDRAYDDSSSSYFIYLYFAKAALQLIKDLRLSPKYLIFHDWHVCGCFAFPQFMRTLRAKNKFTTILLIHNYEYQGEILPDAFNWLDEEVIGELLPVFSEYGTATLLSLGLKNADYVATVSRSYAEELKNGVAPHTGIRFINSAKAPIYSLPNGIDKAIWSPESSPFLPHPYHQFSAGVMKKKAKRYVQKMLGFPDTDDPVILMMARLAEQKGITLLMDLWNSEEAAMEHVQALLDTGIRLIICGRPGGGMNGSIHRRLLMAEERFKGRFGYIPHYSEELAHQLLAGSDAILCPSLYEPCGLVHLYGMSFGTIPIVRPVGGLRDTVVSYEKYPESGTGFYITEFNCKSLIKTMHQVVSLFKYNQSEWQQLILRCMKEDFSWNKAKLQYFQLFDMIEDGHAG